MGSFFNDGAETVLKQYLASRDDDDERLFPIKKSSVIKMFKETGKPMGIKITPQKLRYWFCAQMDELGVPDRYIDAFCGRVPKSMLTRHYNDYSPERLKRIYDKAGLKLHS